MSTPVVECRNGTWKFHKGDGDFSALAFNDKSWGTVTAPHDWREPPTSYTATNAVGWYRREVVVTAAMEAAALTNQLYLALGTVSAADVTYLNGEQIGEFEMHIESARIRGCVQCLSLALDWHFAAWVALMFDVSVPHSFTKKLLRFGVFFLLL